MRSHVYHFGDFSLNPLSRELSRNGESVVLAASTFDCLVYLIEHRERPVGKDELISAVWARADVSENLVAHTIVRLRRALDDASNGQHCIKTVVRVGYRWMLETTVTFQTHDALSAEKPAAESAVHADAVHDDHPVSTPRGVIPTRLSIKIALLLTLALVLAYFLPQVYQFKAVHAEMRFDQNTAIVLPVEVNASDDWSWLHFGLMDMISNQLREANVPTESSQSVINLLDHSDTAASVWQSSFALVVSPHVVLANNSWHVRLDAKSKNGQTWQAEASSSDVLFAARTASDLLLAQMGFDSQANRQASSGDYKQEYLLRIEAARLANATELVQELIDKAPPDLRHTHEFTLAEAGLYCDKNNVKLCDQTLSDLLKQLPANEQPLLRGKALTMFWYIDYHKHRLADGQAALDEAVRLLLRQKDTEALATAYLDRSHLEYYQSKLDEAASDLGSARINYILAGDTSGQAKANFWMGMIAQHRGHFAEALPLLQHAYEQYQRIGMRQVISLPLQALTFAKKMLLLFPDELATTDRYWPFDQKRMNFSDSEVRDDLVQARAIALADNGRRSEANSLLEPLLTQVDINQAADQYAEISATLAMLALERGDSKAALAWVSKAMKETGPQEDNDKRVSAEEWLIDVDALQRTGKFEELDRTVAAMEKWAAHLPEQDDWITIMVMRAKAVQAWSEGKHEQSLDQFKNAMNLAEKMSVPDLIVGVGLPYEMELLNTGHVDQAVSVSGEFLPSWSSLDWRVAWAEANAFKALSQKSAWEASRDRAQQLAGDRILPDGSHAFVY